MKNIVALLVVLGSVIFGFSAETDHYDSLYAVGNNAYQEQNFEDALNTYSVILESGYESADLYYNTANCYYKLNQPTQAILFYERALKLRPLDKDVAYNLDLANKQIVDKIESLPVPFYTEWMISLTHSLSVDVFAFISIIFMLFAVISLLLFFRTNNGMIKRISFFMILVTLVVTGVTYLFASSQYAHLMDNKEAIVLSQRVNIYSAPNTTSTTLFILHDGLKVTILKTENQWNQIMLPDGSIGWIPEEAIVLI